MCAARKNNSLEESDNSAKQPAKKRKPRAAMKEAKLASASKKSLKKTPRQKLKIMKARRRLTPAKQKNFWAKNPRM